jgi:hypothetical protein
MIEITAGIATDFAYFGLYEQTGGKLADYYEWRIMTAAGGNNGRRLT